MVKREVVDATANIFVLQCGMNFMQLLLVSCNFLLSIAPAYRQCQIMRMAVVPEICSKVTIQHSFENYKKIVWVFVFFLLLFLNQMVYK